MSRRSSPYAHIPNQPEGWPVYTKKTMTRSQTIMTPISQPQHQLALVKRSNTYSTSGSSTSGSLPVTPAQSSYQLWTPPDHPTSPVDDYNFWGPRPSYSRSSSSTSSSDDDNYLPVVPHHTASKPTPAKNSVEIDPFGESESDRKFPRKLLPMAAATREVGMQIAVRSPAAHYDKDIHGVMSPATTVHLVLPRGASGRSKRPLPLPTSARSKPRPVGAPQMQRPSTTDSVKSPPNNGLGLALQPPADHRDSALSPRSSMAVRTPARPSLLVPTSSIEIPKSRTTSMSHAPGHTLWKPASAPTTSPLSARPPDQPAALAPVANTHTLPSMSHATNSQLSMPLTMHQRAASSSSVSITHATMSTPSVPSASQPVSSVSVSISNERAEILRRTLSSTNMARASRSDSALPIVATEDSPHSTNSSSTNVEIVVPVAPSPERSPAASSHRPLPSRTQSTILFPTDENDRDLEPIIVETPPLLRVVNVTEADFVISPSSPTPSAPAIEVIPSTPQQPHHQLAVMVEALTPPAVELSAPPEPSPQRTPSPHKHASLPVPQRSPHPSISAQTPASSFRRTSLNDGPSAPQSSSGSRGSYVPSERSAATPLRPQVRMPPMAPPGRTWLPRKPVMPAPLQRMSNHSGMTPSQPPSARSSFQAPPQNFPQRPSHVHSMSEPPAPSPHSPRRLEPPRAPFTQAVNYNSDDDSPSMWASIPEEQVSSRRSSRSSRSYNRHSIYSHGGGSEDEGEGSFPPVPSISMPNLGLPSILRTNANEAPVSRGDSGGKKIQFVVPYDETDDKPSQAAGGRKRIRRRSNSTDSVFRNSREIPWGTNPVPRKSGLVTIPDPYGVKYADEGRYDAINAPELIPVDISQRYIRSDGAPKFPEYRETYAVKEKIIREAAEAEQRARVMGKRPRTPATSVEFDDPAAPVSVPVLLRRPRALSEGGAKLRRRSKSRDRADWAPPVTIPDPEFTQYSRHANLPSSHSTSIIPGALRKFSLFRR